VVAVHWNDLPGSTAPESKPLSPAVTECGIVSPLIQVMRIGWSRRASMVKAGVCSVVGSLARP